MIVIVRQCRNEEQGVIKMNVAQTRMLSWMCGNTRKDHLKDDYIKKKLGMSCTEDKLRVGCLIVKSNVMEVNMVKWKDGNSKWLGVS